MDDKATPQAGRRRDPKAHRQTRQDKGKVKANLPKTSHRPTDRQRVRAITPKPANHLPNPSITTWNARGLGVRLSDSVARSRFSSIRDFFARRRADVFLIQEAKYADNDRDRRAIQGIHGKYHYFHNPLTRSSAGTFIAIRKSLVKGCDVNHRIIDKGYIQKVDITPRDGSFTPFSITNVYLKNGVGRWAEVRGQLDKLMGKSFPTLNFAGGDFNLSHLSDDGVGRRSPVPGGVRARLEELKGKMGVKEVDQNLHTRFGKANRRVVSAKLDLLFSPNSETYAAVYNQTVTLGRPVRGSRGQWLSDHLPVSLNIQPVGEEGRRSFLPDHIFDDSFSEELEVLMGGGKGGCPFKELRRLKKNIKELARRRLRNSRVDKNHPLQRIPILTEALRLLNRGVGGKAELEALKADSWVRRLLEGRDRAGAIRKVESTLNHLFDGLEELVPSFDPSKGTNPFVRAIREGKSLLPSSKRGVDHFMIEVDKGVKVRVEDPESVTGIAKDFWGDIWGEREPEEECIRECIEDYDRILRRDIPPFDEDDLLRIMLKPRKSTPGPDGIPYAAWRCCARVAVGYLFRVFGALAEGRDPPADFNLADLYLLPKKQVMDNPKHTRPISVTNTDNRLLALAVKGALEKVTDDWFHTAQKGFIRGRLIDDNIRDFTKLFYEDEHRKSRGYLLLLDFKKAYDSIHHGFLKSLLREAGFPTWVVNTVGGLMEKVSVRLSLGGAKFVFIPILRGVKQGCPLSPLLFNLVADILIRKLSKRGGVIVKAFADDTGMYFRNPAAIRGIARDIDFVSKATGLTINTTKTVVIPTLPNDREIRTHLLAADWGEVKVVRKAVYLGILIGRGVQAGEVYHKALRKFGSRMGHLVASKGSTSRVKRILYFNRLALPIFSYIQRFYGITPVVEGVIKGWARKYLVSFKDFGLWDLMRPKDLVGLNSPLDDPVNRGISLLVKGHVVSPEEPEFREELSSVEQQRALGFHHAKQFDAEGIKLNMEARDVYKVLMGSVYWRDHHTKVVKRKLDRFGLDEAQKEATIANYARLPNLPDYIRFRFMQLVHNAAPTGRRLKPLTRAHVGPNTPCFLCGNNQEEVDSCEHLFLDCPVVGEAFDRAAISLDVPYRRRGWGFFLLADLADADVRDLVFSVCFGATVLNYRANLKGEGEDAEPTAGGIIQGLRDTLKTLDRHIAAKHNPLYIPGTIDYTKAQQRHSRRKTQAKAKALALIQDHSDDTIIYTDGSADPNPGPCGAGVFIDRQGRGSDILISAPCGHGSNNIGEMRALAIALHSIRHLDLKRVLILSDSLLAINFAKGKFQAKKDKTLANYLRKTYFAIKEKCKLTLEWVPGHMGVQGNEFADDLAGKAAKNSTDYDLLFDDNTDIQTFTDYWVNSHS